MLSHGANQLDSAGVNAGDVGVSCFFGILHGNDLVIAEEFFETRFQLLPLEVDRFVSWEMIQHGRFDSMYQFLRGALCGNKIEPTTGTQLIVRYVGDACC